MVGACHCEEREAGAVLSEVEASNLSKHRVRLLRGVYTERSERARIDKTTFLTTISAKT